MKTLSRYYNDRPCRETIARLFYIRSNFFIFIFLFFIVICNIYFLFIFWMRKQMCSAYIGGHSAGGTGSCVKYAFLHSQLFKRNFDQFFLCERKRGIVYVVAI